MFNLLLIKNAALLGRFIDLHPDSSFHGFTYFFIPTNSIKNLFTHVAGDVNPMVIFHVSFSHAYIHTLGNKHVWTQSHIYTHTQKTSQV